MLEDLVKIGQTAPSGSNCQAWTFTILPTRDAVRQLSEQVGIFFHRLNRLAEKRLLRAVLKWAGRPQLDFYYRNYFTSIRDGIQDWQRTGRDRLFHGASAVILVGGRSGAACPQEDALLAVQNMLLGAHAMGLGTCLIGFAVSAIERASSLKDFLKIPRDESIYAAIAVGFPDERYHRLPGRKPAPVTGMVGCLTRGCRNLLFFCRGGVMVGKGLVECCGQGLQLVDKKMIGTGQHFQAGSGIP